MREFQTETRWLPGGSALDGENPLHEYLVHVAVLEDGVRRGSGLLLFNEDDAAAFESALAHYNHEQRRQLRETADGRCVACLALPSDICRGDLSKISCPVRAAMEHDVRDGEPF